LTKQKELDINDDIFSTIEKRKKKGFGGPPQLNSGTYQIVGKRIDIIARIREKILLHNLEETLKDLNIDE